MRRSAAKESSASFGVESSLAMELSIAFHTLGCKLNQLETESLADAFRKSGALVLGGGPDEAADLVIVNTCTVTGKAEQKARHFVRQALARNPEAVAIVTGCYAQVDPAALASLHERAVVVPGDEKAGLLDLAAFLAEEWQGHGDLLDALILWRRSVGPIPADAKGMGAAPGRVEGPPGGESVRVGRSLDSFAFRPEEFAFHSRPSLKIEDGCDNHCSYCRVRIARGPARSLSAEEILARLRALEASGKAEAVLTGVNLFQYRGAGGGPGGGAGGGFRLPALLRLLLDGTRSIAIRLSSYEPEGIDEEFLEVLAHPRLRPHVHLPVQSGSDRVLRRMARAYRRDQVIAACAALRRVKGDLFVAADLIAGFPGETDEDFADTLDLARSCDFAWIHAFPFSPRPGTAAWNMGPKVPERVAGERARALGALAKAGRADYIRRQVGCEVDAILEGGRPVGEDGLGHATSANYLKLSIEDLPPGLPGGAAIGCRLAPPFDRKGLEKVGQADGCFDIKAVYISTISR